MRTLTEKNWQDIRSQVVSVNPTLANIIDAIDPSNKLKFIAASYLFGDIFINNGLPYLPNKNRLLPLTHEDIPVEIRKELSYAQIPLFLTLKKDCEVFIDTNSRTIPLNLFRAGNLLGLFETVDYMFDRKSNSKWSVSAGARSVMMLPKIGDDSGLSRLRRLYDLPTTLRIKNLSEHWQLFTHLAQNPKIEPLWENKILFFSKEWFNKKNDSLEWNIFRNYLLQQAWIQAQFSIEKVELSLMWEKFVETISSRHLKPRPYLADQVKHLLSISLGNFPAFIPADNSEESVPKKELQAAIKEIYIMKEYIPTLMQISPLNEMRNQYIYYSLSFPTLLEGSPINRTTTTIIHDLRDIKLLIDTLKQYNKDSFFYNQIYQTEFDYFHVEPDIFSEVKSTKTIPTEDPAFSIDNPYFPDKVFCTKSNFFRGCIRLKLPNHQGIIRPSG